MNQEWLRLKDHAEDQRVALEAVRPEVFADVASLGYGLVSSYQLSDGSYITFHRTNGKDAAEKARIVRRVVEALA